MASVLPVRRGSDYARTLILEIARRNRESVVAQGEVNLEATVALLEDALNDPLTRLHVIWTLADLLSSSIEGCVFDLAAWVPPRPPLPR
jgi:hypothetical protein